MSKSVRFQWPHEASGSVRLAGSFNSWQPQDMSFDASDGVWRLERDVAPGKHQFKFVVDGEWVHDAGQPHTPNEVGSENNFLEVLAPMSPEKTKTIEVERKFEVPEDFRERLPAAGFEVVTGFAVESLVDVYYDTRDFSLIKSDHWLRQRNGDWEMKYPVGQMHDGGGVTLYHETSNVDDILARLRSLTKDERDKSNLKELKARGVLAPLVRLETTRHSYRRGEVNIVVDSTDYGFRVGEIELMVGSKADASAAMDKIDAIAKELGLFSDAPKEGKVRSLIRRVNPEAYQILVERDRSMLKT